MFQATSFILFISSSGKKRTIRIQKSIMNHH